MQWQYDEVVYLENPVSPVKEKEVGKGDN